MACVIKIHKLCALPTLVGRPCFCAARKPRKGSERMFATYFAHETKRPACACRAIENKKKNTRKSSHMKHELAAVCIEVCNDAVW